MREFVEAHRGTVAVSDALEGGACFNVTLPLNAPPESSVRVGEFRFRGTRAGRSTRRSTSCSLRDGGSGTMMSAGRARVLVVEDNPEMNRFIREILAAEFTVIGVLDAEAGEQAIAEKQPDLLVTDLMLPGISGRRSDPPYPAPAGQRQPARPGPDREARRGTESEPSGRRQPRLRGEAVFRGRSSWLAHGTWWR